MAAVSTYVAFLRAINVGGRTVKMERLRELFASLGLSGVETFIASGNVIFETRGKGGRPLEARIEAHLKDGLGYHVDTFIRAIGDVRDVAECRAFSPAEVADGTVFVAFVAAPLSQKAVHSVSTLRNENDDFRVDGREIYWLRRSRDSVFTGALIEKAAGVPATIRNMNTVQRLAAKHG